MNKETNKITVAQRNYILSKLPSTRTRRWVIRKKAAVVDAVKKGVISVSEACEKYALSEEELKSWERLMDKGGVHALRATRAQDYRGNKNEETKASY